MKYIICTVLTLAFSISNLISSAAALSNCDAFQTKVDLACNGPKSNAKSCDRAKELLQECLNRIDDGGGDGGGDGGSGGGETGTGTDGSFQGSLNATKLKNKVDDCDARTEISGTLTLTKSGKKKLVGTFSDNPITLKGPISKNGKGYELNGKSKAGKIKNELKVKGSKLTDTSVEVKITSSRKNGDKLECSATYKGTLARQ